MIADQNAEFNGFLVLRLPEFNSDPQGRGAFPSKAPCIGKLCYGGIDRMAWFDVDEDLYNGTLPEPLIRIRKAIKSATADFTGIELCTDLTSAAELLRHSNRANPANELVAIWSPKLAEIKGILPSGGLIARWIGYDVVSLGNWSLLRDGYFASPAFFKNWKEKLNMSGLLPAADLTDEYVKAYQAAAAGGAVEEIADSPYGLDVIRIARVEV